MRGKEFPPQGCQSGVDLGQTPACWCFSPSTCKGPVTPIPMRARKGHDMSQVAGSESEHSKWPCIPYSATGWDWSPVSQTPRECSPHSLQGPLCDGIPTWDPGAQVS